MREREIEKYLVDRVKGMGGMALKFVSPGCTGVPDRLVILPGGKIGFLELKAPGEVPRKEQSHRIRQLRGLGCKAGFADSRQDVDSPPCLAFMWVLRLSLDPHTYIANT